MSNSNQLSYEEAVSRLENIIFKMENGEIPLDDSLRLFEEGIKLYRTCREKLDGAQKKITEIVKVDNEFKEVEFLKAGEDNSDI